MPQPELFGHSVTAADALLFDDSKSLFLPRKYEAAARWIRDEIEITSIGSTPALGSLSVYELIAQSDSVGELTLKMTLGALTLTTATFPRLTTYTGYSLIPLTQIKQAGHLLQEIKPEELFLRYNFDMSEDQRVNENALSACDWTKAERVQGAADGVTLFVCLPTFWRDTPHMLFVAGTSQRIRIEITFAAANKIANGTGTPSVAASFASFDAVLLAEVYHFDATTRKLLQDAAASNRGLTYIFREFQGHTKEPIATTQTSVNQTITDLRGPTRTLYWFYRKQGQVDGALTSGTAITDATQPLRFNVPRVPASEDGYDDTVTSWSVTSAANTLIRSQTKIQNLYHYPAIHWPQRKAGLGVYTYSHTADQKSVLDAKGTFSYSAVDYPRLSIVQTANSQADYLDVWGDVFQFIVQRNNAFLRLFRD